VSHALLRPRVVLLLVGRRRMAGMVPARVLRRAALGSLRLVQLQPQQHIQPQRGAVHHPSPPGSAPASHLSQGPGEPGGLEGWRPAQRGPARVDQPAAFARAGLQGRPHEPERNRIQDHRARGFAKTHLSVDPAFARGADHPRRARQRRFGRQDHSGAARCALLTAGLRRSADDPHGARDAESVPRGAAIPGRTASSGQAAAGARHEDGRAATALEPVRALHPRVVGPGRTEGDVPPAIPLLPAVEGVLPAARAQVYTEQAFDWHDSHVRPFIGALASLRAVFVILRLLGPPPVASESPLSLSFLAGRGQVTSPLLRPRADHSKRDKGGLPPPMGC